MGTKNCMNEVCPATTSSDWKKGWSLKSGGFASLCDNCGSAYENFIFCETFHLEDSGWRPCRVCGKMVHCGCIASIHLHEYMDTGGVSCRSCAKRLEIHAMQTMQIPGDIRNGIFAPESIINDSQSIAVETGINDAKFEHLEQNESPIVKVPQMGRNLASTSLHIPGDVRNGTFAPKSIINSPQSIAVENRINDNKFELTGLSVFVKPEPQNIGPKQSIDHMPEFLAQPCLNFSISPTPPLAGSSSVSVVEGSDQSKCSSLQRARHVHAKPPKRGSTAGSQVRVMRPLVEGRGRSQLLPRYWPRITNQELQQLSGDLNSTIVPLFEKVLSASDAGRIGRLVLPKACAEAYFPPINQSEGIPIKIWDITGKEWTFQFRFWPNNNSRMYVLEGVTPCIQSMQLQAGDTVIFSRRYPEAQLVIGCRKSKTNTDVKETQTSVVTNTDPPGDTSSSGGNDNLPTSGGGGFNDSRPRRTRVSKKKKARNIKNKRLLMHDDDAIELRITWEEAQELLRPPPSTEPTVVVIEDHEFEEYEEPPIIGKKTVFISQPFRSSCCAPEETSLREPEFSRTNKDHKKQKLSNGEGGEPSGLSALANAAALGGELVAGPTTRHPRHRPGCMCIVCIQPPSGRGRHDPSCNCNVCLTVKRRFKTLMLRKKKRHSEQDSNNNNNNNNDNNNHEMSNNDEGKNRVDMEEVGNARLDLNSDPHREDEILAGHMYLGPNGLSGLLQGPSSAPWASGSGCVDDIDTGGDGGGMSTGDGNRENGSG